MAIQHSNTLIRCRPRQLALTDQECLPDKSQVLFRYDPPVLIISLTWHEKRAAFAELLCVRLRVSYFDNADDVRPPDGVRYAWDTNMMCRSNG